uniref:Transcription initiation factor IIA subunit 2 n=1 Tax=Catagonus wagneri TaxID=51154 RepID=A0A8C3VI06_9CETA
MVYRLYRNTTLGDSLRQSLMIIRGSLNTYRFCGNVWTFVLNDVEFREVTELIKVDKVKIVACDGKNTLTGVLVKEKDTRSLFPSPSLSLFLCLAST